MAFSSGFFNSKGLDRTYTAENFTDYLSSLICNGILDTYGEQFELTAPTKGLKVILGTGKAWINGHYFINDAKYSIDLSEYQDESLPRYVTIGIVCDVSEGVRDIRIEVVAGTPAENPSVPFIPVDVNRSKLTLYAVRLNVGATSLSDFDWFDYRNDYNLCGYCRCILGKCRVSEVIDKLDEYTRTIAALQEEVSDLTERLSSITGEIVETGKIGENIFYTLYSDGLMTIQGSGATDDYTGTAALYGYVADYTSPFYKNQTIKKVRFDSGITHIGNWLLGSANYLEQVNIPRNTETIGDVAFSATRLKSVEIPKTCTEIGSGAFAHSDLESIVIPANVKNVKAYAFSGCDKLKKVVLRCESVGTTCFTQCTALEELTIGVKCTMLGGSMLAYCVALKQITYEGTLKQWSEIKKGHLWDGRGGNVTNGDSGLEKIMCTNGYLEYKDYKWVEVMNNA